MKIYLLTLGCAKNRDDSECLAGALKAAGHELVPEVEQAQAAIVNTCGFIRPAVEESIDAILDLEELRQSGELEKIGVVGCLVNRYREGLTSEIPSVDFWAETEDWESVLKSLATPLDGARRRGSLPSTPKYTRYLKISEGCGNRCAYCAIPSIRGPLRSLPVDVIVKEAQQLVGEGARELCVVRTHIRFDDLWDLEILPGARGSDPTPVDSARRSPQGPSWPRAAPPCAGGRRCGSGRAPAS